MAKNESNVIVVLRGECSIDGYHLSMHYRYEYGAWINAETIMYVYCLCYAKIARVLSQNLRSEDKMLLTAPFVAPEV